MSHYSWDVRNDSQSDEACHSHSCRGGIIFCHAVAAGSIPERETGGSTVRNVCVPERIDGTTDSTTVCTGRYLDLYASARPLVVFVDRPVPLAGYAQRNLELLLS